LVDLADATIAFVSGAKVDKVNQRISILEQSSNDTELKILAKNFVYMRGNILERINNLNALNEFAFVLTQAKTDENVYEQVTHLIREMFNIKSCVVLDEENHIIWQSKNETESNLLNEKNIGSFTGYQVDIVRAKNGITYENFCCHEVMNNDSNNHFVFPKSILYMPFYINRKEKFEFWFMDNEISERLADGGSLKPETRSCLQVVINMLSATLTNIHQTAIIEQQKLTLEQRVMERTQELAAANEELQHMAVHDPLTALPNRVLFSDKVDHMINLATRDGSRFAVVSIDLTNFKQINDTYGHSAGDAVLVAVGQRLSQSLKSSDTLARIGGDEYAAIISCSSFSSINLMINNVIESLKSAICLGERESVLVEASIGAAVFPDHATDADTLFRYANMAMYKAKRTGMNYSIFDLSENTEERKYFDFLHELEHAVDKSQLCLHFQPILDLKTMKPISCEALIRWNHPLRGLILPNDFIPLAERTMAIKDMTLWVFEQSCQQCSQWHQMGYEIGVSINLSQRVFSAIELPEKFFQICQIYNLDPKWIKLEITESAAMNRPEKSLEIISTYTELGFVLSIDDFGTGHTSLSYLSKFPLKELKIDRSFVTQSIEKNDTVVKAIIDLSKTLEFDVVAEGIEDQATLDSLVKQGCSAAQGFYICRPAEEKKITQWLKHHYDQNLNLQKASGS